MRCTHAPTQAAVAPGGRPRRAQRQGAGGADRGGGVTGVTMARRLFPSSRIPARPGGAGRIASGRVFGCARSGLSVVADAGTAPNRQCRGPRNFLAAGFGTTAASRSLVGHCGPSRNRHFPFERRRPARGTARGASFDGTRPFFDAPRISAKRRRRESRSPRCRPRSGRNPPCHRSKTTAPSISPPPNGPLSMAATARLIPSDGEGPGAYETRVPVFNRPSACGRLRAGRGLVHEGPHDPASSANLGYQTPLTPAEIYRDAIARFDDWCVETEGRPVRGSLRPMPRMRRCSARGRRRPQGRGCACRARGEGGGESAGSDGEGGGRRQRGRIGRIGRRTRRRVRASCATKAPSSSRFFCRTPRKAIFPIRATAAITAWRPGSISAFPAPAPISSNGSTETTFPTRSARFQLLAKGPDHGTHGPPQGCRHRRSRLDRLDHGMEMCEEGLEVLALERGPDRDTVPRFPVPQGRRRTAPTACGFEFMQRPRQSTMTIRHTTDDVALPFRRWGARSCWRRRRPAPGIHWNGVHWRSPLVEELRLRSYVEENFGADIIPEGMQLQDGASATRSWSRISTGFEQVAGHRRAAGNLNGEIIEGGNPFEGPRSNDFPMPAAADDLVEPAKMFAEAAQAASGNRPFVQAGGNASQAYVNPYGMQLGPCNFLRLLRALWLPELLRSHRRRPASSMRSSASRISSTAPMPRVLRVETGAPPPPPFPGRPDRHRRDLVRRGGAGGGVPARRHRDPRGLPGPQRAPDAAVGGSGSPMIRRPAKASPGATIPTR